MRIVFFGTPDVAVPALEALLAAPDVEVVAAVTNPDRPRGRSRTPVPPPVKEAARRAGVPVLQPQKAREVLGELQQLAPDACAVVAYGALLPADVLAAGGAGFVNLHFSLLPRWRGAAPVQHALRAGDGVSGVTAFVLDEGMDTGPVLATLAEPVREDDDAGSLLDRLARLGAPVLVEALRALVGGGVPTPQPAEGATLAPKIGPDDLALDLTATAVEVERLVRSASPAPGAHTRFRDRRLKVLRAVAVSADAPQLADTLLSADGAAPGTVLGRGAAGVVVACGEGAVELRELQPEGRARMDGIAFANGYAPQPGERLGA